MLSMYWDLPNARPSIEQVRATYCFALKSGPIIEKNVYADWRIESKKLANIFDDLGFKCLNAPACKTKKNNGDKKLIKDCLQDVYNNADISTVFLGSGDGDFIPLVRKLKARGIEVILITRSPKNTSVKLQEIVDKVYLLDYIEQEFGSQCFETQKIPSLIHS